MAVQVLGISGSPILDSNTDRAIQKILELTGLTTKFIKLSDHYIEPCRACLGCVNSNECVLVDDARELAKEFHDAPAFVIGGYTPYSSLDARTKAFMERMYCYRHLVAGNSGKIGAAVVTTACPEDIPGLPPAAETATAQIGYWMATEGMENLGTMVVHGNVPCIRCGRGDSCPVSGVKALFGPDADVASVGVRTFEEEEALLARSKELAEKIEKAVLLRGVK